MNALQKLLLTVFTQRNFVAYFLQAKCDFRRKSAVLCFESPFGNLGTTYDDHLRLIGKRVSTAYQCSMNFFSQGITAEALRANIVSKSAISLQRGPRWPKISSRRGRPINLSSFQKTKLNDLSYDINTWTDLSSVLSQCTRLTDGQTDRLTEFSSQNRVCIPCSAVKT